MNPRTLERAFLHAGQDPDTAQRKAQEVAHYADPILQTPAEPSFYARHEHGRWQCVVLARHAETTRAVRDREGRPVLVQYGNVLQGTSAQQICQAVHAMAQAYEEMSDETVPEVRIVFDMRDQSFQVSPSVVSALLRFPQTVRIDVCAASPAYVACWNALRWVVPRSLLEVCSVSPDYSEVLTHLDASQLPQEWGGKATWMEPAPPTARATSACSSPSSSPFSPTGVLREEEAVLAYAALVAATLWTCRDVEVLWDSLACAGAVHVARLLWTRVYSNTGR